jgi:hypothetical protein
MQPTISIRTDSRGHIVQGHTILDLGNQWDLGSVPLMPNFMKILSAIVFRQKKKWAKSMTGPPLYAYNLSIYCK